MKTLEFECFNCEKKLILDVSDKDYQDYHSSSCFTEGSDAYYDFFESHGWVLKQSVFCDICKYNHSECYNHDV